MKKTLRKAALAGLTALALGGCGGERIDRFSRGELCESYGVVKEKNFSPDYTLRRLGLTATNYQGEKFVDNYLVWLVDVPEFPNTTYGINSPSLYNSFSIGDTVSLTLQEHNHWLEDIEGKTITNPETWVSIESFGLDSLKTLSKCAKTQGD